MTGIKHTINFAQLGMHDLEQVGGKNSSLGEMISHLSSAGVLVPGGFATTAESFKEFLAQDGLDQRIYAKLASLNTEDTRQLAQAGKEIRDLINATPFTVAFEQEVKAAYQQLTQAIGHDDFSVAVRSSATAEDLPDASFAGQQETFLNVKGIDDVLSSIKEVFASLFNDRAIAYRVHHNFAHDDVALSAGIQQMIRSDLAVSGVMFTMDTESGFNDVVFITSSYGLGEMVVQGAVNPDEFYVHKPGLKAGKPAIIRRNIGSKALKMVYCDDASLARRVKTVDVDSSEQLVFSLTNDDVTYLAQQAVIIEAHYGRPMDIEWAKDGVSGKLYILQARPETVKSRDNKQMLERYSLKQRSEILAEGRSIGQRIGQGRARVIKDINEMHKVEPGDVLISDMT
ncbi:MAG: PEP/pyruvate-binding domain-containing protein, partial [Legionella sp.]